MNHNPTTTIRIPQSLKDDANAVFKELGITMSAAINAFLSNVARQKQRERQLLHAPIPHPETQH